MRRSARVRGKPGEGSPMVAKGVPARLWLPWGITVVERSSGRTRSTVLDTTNAPAMASRKTIASVSRSPLMLAAISQT
ncbi:Uncharacterised protein [Mycobacterium tuberculosis]|uniref:Uncharacterized protein n=1 Tax=Mycobacterium tuberculosis TaxID=1773 RepID=A0A654U502_MYCTX|nr:Uncharacterised protein [Mycobacterium tuberculosis]